MKTFLLSISLIFCIVCKTQVINISLGDTVWTAKNIVPQNKFGVVGYKYVMDSVMCQTKYRSDTARANTYAALAGKQPTGNYLTSLVTGTGSIGYSSGNGGVVTQATSKSTGVTLNKLAGEVTMNGAALSAATIVSFTLTNSTIAATDVIILNHVTTGTRGGYTLNAQCGNGSAVIYVRNNTAGSLSEAIVIRYVVIKSANN